MNLNVPRASTIDLNICFFKQVNDDFFCVHRNIVRARNMLALMQKRPRVRSLLEYYFFFLSLFFYLFIWQYIGPMLTLVRAHFTPPNPHPPPYGGMCAVIIHQFQAIMPE